MTDFWQSWQSKDVAWRLALAALPLLTLSAFAQEAPDYAESSAKCVPALREEAVSRDERRQQILAGIHEYRYSYTLAHAPEGTSLFAECYIDGRMIHRFQLTSAMHGKNPEHTKGIFSLGWNYLRHEMTLINDTGFGLWNARIAVVPEVMDSPTVIKAENPHPELRDTINNYPAKQVTIYPIIGLVGKTSDKAPGQVHFTLSRAADLLDQAAKYHIRQCIIIYMFGTDGFGAPPFAFEGETSFYVNSLPIN